MGVTGSMYEGGTGEGDFDVGDAESCDGGVAGLN